MCVCVCVCLRVCVSVHGRGYWLPEPIHQIKTKYVGTPSLDSDSNIDPEELLNVLLVVKM